MNWIRDIAKVVVALTWMVSASAWADEGYIYDAVGEVFVSVGKGAAHRAVRNDTLVSDTVIMTGDKSHAILKFADGQVAVMQANTTFVVHEYRYEPKQVEKSNIVFSMLKGGMRFVTGLIGQRNKEAFRLSTPNATIGIRGTEFMVAMAVNNPSMYSQVVSGSIGMTNAAGTVAFTAGETAVVASATALPTAISAAALPAGTFTQLGAIPVPPATPAPAPAPAGATAGAATGISATTIAIGAGVAAVAASVANTTTTTHH